MRRAGLTVWVCMWVLAVVARTQAVANRPEAGVQATQESPDFAHTRRVPMELLDRRRDNPMILPREPGSVDRDEAAQSEAVFGKVPERQRRLPEGYVLGSRRARIEKQGAWWLAVLEPAEDMAEAPPLRLLPNETLEVIEAVLAESTEPITFLLTGRVTEFQSKNYLLVEHAAQVQRAPGGKQAAAREPAGAAGGDAPAEPGGAPSATDERADPETGGSPPTAQEVADELMAMEPVRALVMPQPATQPEAEQRQDAGEQAGERSAPDQPASADGWSEGTLLIDRVGRVVAGDGKWRMLAFEDPGMHARLEPIRLLPNRLLETALSLSSEGASASEVFQVSGEVTVYRNERYLLLRKVLARRNLGNLR